MEPTRENRPVYWVAGVGGGLGTAVAAALAGRGAHVVGLARSRSSLDALVAYAQTRQWSLRVEQADLGSAEDVGRARDATLAAFGRLDGVALLAGRWVPGATKLLEMSPEEWRLGLDDNLGPVYTVLHAVVPALVRGGGGSVVLVSAAEEVRRQGSASYAAAKAGIAELARKLGGEFRTAGVRVNAVLPGNMEHAAALDEPPSDRRIPLADHTATSPWEVAKAIRFLLTDEARWITGTTLTVDGGFSLRGE